MDYIDPRSPRESGWDLYGNQVELGDTDSDGHFVGYIDDQGVSWESKCERDCAIVAGQFFDAWVQWNNCGGVLGVEPQPSDFMDDCDEENRDMASAHAFNLIDTLTWGIKTRARQARMN